MGLASGFVGFEFEGSLMLGLYRDVPLFSEERDRSKFSTGNSHTATLLLTGYTILCEPVIDRV